MYGLLTTHEGETIVATYDDFGVIGEFTPVPGTTLSSPGLWFVEATKQQGTLTINGVVKLPWSYREIKDLPHLSLISLQIYHMAMEYQHENNHV